jgi:hypothetical protein
VIKIEAITNSLVTTPGMGGLRLYRPLGPHSSRHISGWERDKPKTKSPISLSSSSTPQNTQFGSPSPLVFLFDSLHDPRYVCPPIRHLFASKPFFISCRYHLYLGLAMNYFS